MFLDPAPVRRFKNNATFGLLPLFCYLYIKQNQNSVYGLPFVIGWMLLHFLSEGLTLPTPFQKTSSIPRGGEFRGVFVAKIVTSSPGAAEQSFLLAPEDQTAVVNPGVSFVSLSVKFSSRVV